MLLKPIAFNADSYPEELHDFLRNAKLYNSSSSPEAQVTFIAKDEGLFLKRAPKHSLGREVLMTKYFHGKGLAAPVLAYMSDDYDWMLTAKLPGDDCTAEKYLSKPEKLCDRLAERLRILHGMDFGGCPVQNHTEQFIEKAEENHRLGRYYNDLPSDYLGFKDAEEGYTFFTEKKGLLQTDTLLHGDYCMPNIIFNDWKFSGFVDLDSAGVGDRHVDLFWGLWSLLFNLKTPKYRQRFIDAYGRELVDEERLRVIAAAEF